VSERPILVVDDDDALRETIVDVLEVLGHPIEQADSAAAAIARMDERVSQGVDGYAVVVTDLVMAGEGDGFGVLEKARTADDATRIVMLTGHGSREAAVQAMQKGATYYIEKPIDLAELRTKVEKCREEHARAVEFRELREQVRARTGVARIIGQDPRMMRVFDTIKQVAPTNATVLILGESGTGKELIARAIHDQSRRAKQRFVALNCGSLAEGTIESELFGHVRGAYTGASGDREGKFEYADGGTLFLDEVGEMPLQTQVKFLRVLEEREVQRLGANKSTPIDVRVIAATNADIESKIQTGDFREDLFFRLKVVTLRLPPLRERRADIKLLVDHFVAEFSKIHGKDVEHVDRDVLVAMVGYPWPGNVRELRNAVESMVVRARGNILTVDDLPPEIPAEPGQPAADSSGSASGTEAAGDPWEFLAGRPASEVERNHIRVTLEREGGNRVRAAKAMGISERTLYRKLHEYGLRDEG
jgi:two-component system response regulator HydG